MAVNPIPKGFHTLTPSLIVNDAKKAIDFYKKAFGAKELMRMETPQGKIGHAELQIGDSIIFVNDEFPGCPSATALNGSPVSLHLYLTNVDAAFDQAVKAGATVQMPLQDMFWGDRFGTVADPFGHRWGLAQHVEDVAPADMEKRAQEAFAKMTAA